MHSIKQKQASFFILALGFFSSLGFAQEAEQSEREAMYHRYLKFPSYVKGGSIEPHWMADGNSFWYAEGALGGPNRHGERAYEVERAPRVGPTF